MSQFKKYLVHFSLVIFLIFVLLAVLCLANNEEIKWWFPSVVFICIWVIYAIPMSCIYNKKSNIEEIELSVNNGAIFYGKKEKGTLSQHY